MGSLASLSHLFYFSIPVLVGLKIFPTAMPRASQHLVQRLVNRAASREGLKGAFSDSDGTGNAPSVESALAPWVC